MKSVNKQFRNFLKSEPVLDFCKIRSYFQLFQNQPILFFFHFKTEQYQFLQILNFASIKFCCYHTQKLRFTSSKFHGFHDAIFASQCDKINKICLLEIFEKSYHSKNIWKVLKNLTDIKFWRHQKSLFS